MKHIRLFLTCIIFSVLFLSCSNLNDSNENPNDLYPLEKVGDSTNVILFYGQTRIVAENLAVKFVDVPHDSRCPIDVQCFWAGDAEVELQVKTEATSRIISLHTTLDPRCEIVGNYSFELQRVYPPPISTTIISENDYYITLKVKMIDPHLDGDEIKLIDTPNDPRIITNDAQINDAHISGDNLTLNTSYSGGCENHIFELFALKTIEKSNPARVSIYLSHNSNNDICEAYLTADHTFDLRNLKQYLTDTYDITDQVILLIHDPKGNRFSEELIYNVSKKFKR